MWRVKQLMKISTRSRYGARFMTALAEQYGLGPVQLKEVAAQESISEKYLSLILIPLRTAGLVTASRGPKGGYRLALPPEEITMRQVIDVLEGETILVDCINNPTNCSRVATCATRDIWSVLSQRIRDTLEGIRLSDLVTTKHTKACQSECRQCGEAHPS